MAIKKKRKTDYEKHLLELMDAYAAETGRDEVDVDEFTSWAEVNNHLQIAQLSLRKKFSRDASKAASKDFILDEDGEPVRRRLSYRNKKTQKTFWKVMEKMTPEQFHTLSSVNQIARPRRDSSG